MRALGVGQRAVNIKDQCLQVGHVAAPLRAV